MEGEGDLKQGCRLRLIGWDPVTNFQHQRSSSTPVLQNAGLQSRALECLQSRASK